MRASAAQRIEELAAEVAELRQTVERLAAAPVPPNGDAESLISVTAAAELAEVTTQTIRNWVDRYGIGRFIDPAYLVDRRLLREHLIRHRGKLPSALSRG